LTHEHDRKRDKSIGGPSPAKVEAGLVGPAADLSALGPKILRLPGREPIDVRGLSVEDVIGMIRDACRAPDQDDREGGSVDASPAQETPENTTEGASEVPSESSPEDTLLTDVTTPGGWTIIGCGDENGEHGCIVEGTIRPSKSRERKP
jgi:hypothetical protein